MIQSSKSLVTLILAVLVTSLSPLAGAQAVRRGRLRQLPQKIPQEG